MRIVFDAVAPGRAFHAVLTESRAPVEPHGHDFCETMLVVSGSGRHLLNGATNPLAPGDAAWLGPSDHHALVPGRDGMGWFNVAFPARSWEAFALLAGVAPPAGFHPPAAPFARAVEAYHRGEGGLALAAFLAAALAPPPSSVGPGWLAQALATLETEAGLQAGVPGLLMAASVSPSHLARTIRAATGLCPTDYVNERRLLHAQMLLATTRREIPSVALDCGYASLSYFYRSFSRRFGATPLDSRRRAQAPLRPS